MRAGISIKTLDMYNSIHTNTHVNVTVFFKCMVVVVRLSQLLALSTVS